jgi:hypothetical protein
MKLNEEVITNDKWEIEDQELFWKIIKRKRDKISQVRAKGRCLAKTNIPEKIKIGIGILNRFTDDFFAKPDEVLAKEKYPSLYREDLIDVCRDKLKYALQLNDTVLAEKICKEGATLHFYESKNEIVQNEFDKGKSHFYKCIIYCDLAAYYINLKQKEKAKKWLALHFESGKNNYSNYYNDCYATHLKYANLANDFSYCKYIRENCYPSFDEYLSHSNKDYIDIVSKKVDNDLATIAEGLYMNFHAHPLCKTIHIRSKKALKELDLVLHDPTEYSGERYDIDSHNFDFQLAYLLPEMGAYLGEVMCKEYKGKWILGTKVLDSTILISKVSLSPFKYAFDVIRYGYRLSVEIADDIEGKISFKK